MRRDVWKVTSIAQKGKKMNIKCDKGRKKMTVMRKRFL